MDSGWEATLKSDGLIQKLKKGAIGAIKGCEKIGNVRPLLNKGDRRKLPAGSLVFAYHDAAPAAHDTVGYLSSLISDRFTKYRWWG